MSVQRNEIMLAGAFFLILGLLIVPLPAVLIDLLLALSITVSILILLVTLYTEKPLDFSVFPSLLLMVTLLRLGLNVASTRLILVSGSDGPGAAGAVINAFGNITVGGNYLVGLILFLIFVVINFVVIAKGAGRIAEVAARFTLDAMPGKQMAIDADLNQGLLDDSEAKRRRREVQREADFYGAMDGASKFVKGDAIAGLLIMGVNIIGGLAVGVGQEGMPLFDALETYTVLTVGDGLVGQIPALVVSTAAGMVVTRAAGGAPLADEIFGQVLLQPRALWGVTVMLTILALMPGFPFTPFALLAAGTAAMAMFLVPPDEEVLPEEGLAEAMPGAGGEPEDIGSALALDDLELEIGYGLIPLTDPERGGELLSRIRATRRQLASELGFVVPLVHIRDNLQLEPGGYSIVLRGNPIAGSEIPPGRALALHASENPPAIEGLAGQDPSYGLPAVWIQERDRARAEALGYSVVDPAATIATHLAETIRIHASELLTRKQVRELLDRYAEDAPQVVDEIVPSIVTISSLQRTLKTLLKEGVSIRDLGAILEVLAEYAPKIQDPDLITDLVRERLGRTLTRAHVGQDGALHVITLDANLEEQLRSSVQRTESGSFLAMDPESLDQLVRGIETSTQKTKPRAGAREPVLLISQTVRAPLAQLLARVAPRLSVMSHNEIPPETQIVADGRVELAHAH